ncbi:MAG TPA: hypothetical protein VGG63_07110 [Steroidobacteraceae bacterium]|jgi:hypothetical protein
MSSTPASAIPLCASLIVAAALAGCSSVRVSAQLPSGVHLAGDWKLDPARSDDLGKAVQELHTQHMKARHDADQQQPQQGVGGYGRRHGGGAGQGGQQGGESGQSESQEPEPAIGGIGPTRSSPVDELMSNVPQGDYLRIKVSSGAFTVVSGASSDEYTPGVESDVSAEQGDAQQISGWKGTDYVIDTKPQFGAEIIQTYSITQDGTLSMTLRLSGSGTNFTFTRIYDRTTSAPPLAPPTLN